MTKTLVIAEKPSVAQDIVRALTPTVGAFAKHDEYFENDRFIVTSAVGHLLEIKAPEEFDVKRGKWSFAHLPVIPPFFDLHPVEKTKSRLSAVVKQAKRKDVSDLINACDAGREGELIFRLIEQFAGGRDKNGQFAPLGKPVQRLWLQSMTPQAIRDGFKHLRPDAQMRGLADAAKSRSEADWLVGINGTRAMTAFNSRDGGFFLTTVGRVQTPTLSIVVEREEKIRQFVSRDYWEIFATFEVKADDYLGKWFDPEWKKDKTAAKDSKENKDEQDNESRADRLWNVDQAKAIAEAVRGKMASISEESKPATQASPLLFDLTSLQREANSKFGFSAKTTLSLAQSLYERHKALTYPRTDSRALPEDYLPVAKQTFEMLSQSHLTHLAPHADFALKNQFVRLSKRIFDNSKVSDHFAIIPTLQAPTGLSEAEQKLYDLVARRFMAVFYPSAEYLITTRISQVLALNQKHHFKTEGKVLVKAGWLSIYGKTADEFLDDSKESHNKNQTDKDSNPSAKTQNLVPIEKNEPAKTIEAQSKALKTRPPARYSEATLLGAMEGAGKLIENEELRQAMHEKGLGTPATRASIIEGLLSEKYIVREDRDLIPTAKAFQLMTLLRGLGVKVLSSPELTGAWESKLADMEKGLLKREDFMRQIAEMTQDMVKKAKEYDRETIPGNYITLIAQCPLCTGVVKENYRRYACTGLDAQSDGCGFSFSKSPAGRTFEQTEAEAFLRDKHIGPLEGFRSKAGWPFVAEMRLKFNDEDQNWKLEFDFGEDKNSDNSEPVDFEKANAQSLGQCPKCKAPVYEHGKNYVCSQSVPTPKQMQPTCDFKTGQIVLQQAIDHAQIQKLLSTGKTDLLDQFVSTRTKRKFKAFLAWSESESKTVFEFEASKYPAKTSKATAKSASKVASKTIAKTQAKSTASSKSAAKSSDEKPVRKARQAKEGSGKTPSPQLAAVIGSQAVLQTEAIKKMWDYIKANHLQDLKDKRNINADEKLRPIFGADQINMFKLAGILSQHLS